MSITESLKEYSVLFFSKRTPKQDLLHQLNLDNKLIDIPILNQTTS